MNYQKWKNTSLQENIHFSSDILNKFRNKPLFFLFQMTKKALVFIANGSEEIEAVTAIDGLLVIFN